MRAYFKIPVDDFMRAFAKLVILLVFGIVLINLFFIVMESKVALTAFYKLQFDYTEARETLWPVSVAVETKTMLPKGATVKVTPYYTDIRSVVIRYDLYPTQVSTSGEYILDLDGAVNINDEQWQSHEFGYGTRLLAPQGCSFSFKRSEAQPVYVYYIFLYMLCYSALTVIVGKAVLARLNIKAQDAFCDWGACFLAGYLYLTSAAWIFLLCGGRLDKGPLFLVWIFACSLLLPLLRKTRCAIKDPSMSSTSSDRKTINLLLTIPTIFIITMVFIIIVLRPIVDWDAMSNWMMKAKVIFHTQHLQFDYTHLNWYPILWPLNIACQYTILGGMVDPVAQWTAGIFFVVFISQLFRGLKILGIKDPARTLAVLMYILLIYRVFSPEKIGYTYIWRADATNIFLAYLGGVVTYILSWLKSERKNNGLIAALVMALGLSLSKLEGAFITFFIVCALLWVLRQTHFNNKDRMTIAAFFIVMLVPLAWIAWVKAHGYGESVAHLASGLSIEKILFQGKLIAKYALINTWPLSTLIILIYVCLVKTSRSYTIPERFLLHISVLLIIFGLTARLGLRMEDMEKFFIIDFPRLFLYSSVSLCLYFASRLYSQDEDL